MTKHKQKFRRLTCLLTIFSTVERFNGADVEFSISLVSWPVYITIPVKITLFHSVYRYIHLKPIWRDLSIIKKNERTKQTKKLGFKLTSEDGKWTRVPEAGSSFHFHLNGSYFFSCSAIFMCFSQLGEGQTVKDWSTYRPQLP